MAMEDVSLEFKNISSETKGALCIGNLKLSEAGVVFKNIKTGKVDQLNATDMETANWIKLAMSNGLRIFLRNGMLHRFFGFKETEREKISKFFEKNYDIEFTDKLLSVRGWNWGTVKFAGSVMSFDVKDLTAFEIPLTNVSQCTTGKNEVTLEFHQNDDTPVSLMEMRFHIPSSELAGAGDPVDAFQEQVLKKASIISISGDAIAIFREIQCLTPRGRYDIKIYPMFFQLHGKTFDYKVPMSTVIRIFYLPHKDGRQNFLVISLDPPIKQGQTRYHYLVWLFNQDEETSLELPFTEQELQEKYDGRLKKEISGATFEVLGKILKVLVNRKVTSPGNFKGHSGTPAISCSYKAAAGYLYPLEHGFIFIHKPPMHIRHDEIANVEFARNVGTTRSFDIEIELKSGVQHTFSSIEKEEYGKLYDFVRDKKLRVSSRGNTANATPYAEDYRDSDQEDEPDAYMERMKREGKEKIEGEDEDDEDESEDEDYKPTAIEEDVPEEYSSNPSDTDSDEDDENGSNKSKKEKKEKRDKPKKSKTVSEKPRKRKNKKEKDSNRPKRAVSAYMLWLNDTREEIKRKYPGISVTDIAKKGGEMWKQLSSDDKKKWDEKAAKAKEEYQEAMKVYLESGGGKDDDSGDEKPAKKSSKASKSKVAVSHTTSGSGSHFKSKEFIEDDSSDDDSDDSKKKKKTSKDEKQGNAKRKKESDSEEEKRETKRAKEKQSDDSTSSSTDDDDKSSGKKTIKDDVEMKSSDSLRETTKKESPVRNRAMRNRKNSVSDTPLKVIKDVRTTSDGESGDQEEEEEEEEVASTPEGSDSDEDSD